MADSRRVQDLPRDRGHNSMKRDKLNFRHVARQVMLANMFTKIQTNAKAQVRAKMPAEGGERSTIAKTQELLLDEKPLRRRGTPELFPMSEEMRQAVIALGKLDLLPDEEKVSLEDDKSSVANTRERNKFRDQTHRRIINPQRFIRNVRSSLNNKSSFIREKTAEQGNEDDRDFKESSEGQINWLSNKERRTTNYHILSRRHTTVTTKSPRNLHSQHSLINMPPLYFTRSSDLGSRTAKTTTRRTTRRQETWPVGAFPQSYISSSRAQKRLPNGDIENPITAWTEGNASSTVTSTYESVTKGEEMVKTRRWKSGEMLATEIEEKCLEWLENRYGITQ